MGVHGLWRLLDTFGEVTQPSDWRGKRVAIDASIWMSQFRAKCTSGENMEQCILEGFFLRILKLLFYGIEPVFVFDGTATDLKSTERRRRAERRAALERSALTRRAQQIVKAQLASGLLNVQALDQKVPVKTAGRPPSPKKETDAGMLQSSSLTNISDTATGCFSTNPRSLLRKRRREIVLEPDAISRTLTDSFLTEAEEWIEERKRGEMCVEANLLFYSSTSLFMGPRGVLEDKINAPIKAAVLPEKDTNPPAYMSLSSLSSEEASLVISDDDKTSINDYETVSTGITSSRGSVVIVGGHPETFPDRLREMEEITIHSLHDDSCDTWLEKDMATCDDILSFCNEGDSSGGSGHSNSDHDDSVQLWNPGTQLICQSSTETTRKHREVSDDGIERPKAASIGSVEETTREGSSSPVTKNLMGAVDVTRSLETPSPSHPPQTLLPKPITKGAKAHQVIPFELLEILELLDCCGIPFVLSPHEADAQCAFLSQQRLVDAVFSEDSDVIVHGANVVLRGFFSNNRYVVVYRQSDLAMCGVDKDVLVALALLLGCDYAEGVDGVSLLEALRIITAFWHQESVQGPSHVLDMLTRWRDAVAQRRFVWEEEGVLLQSYLNWRRWSTLRVAADFPQVPVVDAFFSATVDADMRPFAVASPEWNRLRTFAGMHGLLGDVTCQQRLELAQKAFLARELQRNNERKQQQLRLTDFAMPSHAKEKVAYKKQPPKFAAALSALRAARRSGANKIGGKETPMPGHHAEKGNGDGRRNNDKNTTISEGLISLDGEMSSFDDAIDKQNYHKGNGSFGLPRYVPRYPFDQSRRESVLNVPWHLRKPGGLEQCTFFDSFRSVKFWRQSEFALRITLFAVLLPASLIAAELPNSPFVSNTHCLSAAVLASKVTVGEGLAYLVTWTRAGCIWLPLATIGAAANLGNYIVGWCFFYTLLLFLMATFTENMVRRICLLLFNSCMFGILMDPQRGTVYPSQVMSDWCIGTGLCLVATFLPYPVFSKNKAHRALAEIARNTGTALTGMSSCFWSESNVTRNMAMTKVRMMTAAIDLLMKRFRTAHEDSFYEFIFEGFEPWEVREAKVKLFERLRANLRGLSRVLDILESKPWVVDDSERSRAFGALIQQHVLRFSNSLDKLTEELASASSFGQIRQLHSHFVELNDVTVKLQHEFDQARRRLFYENKPGTLEEFVPLMTFFIFSIVNFRDTMLQFDSEVQRRKHLLRNSIKRVVDKTMLEPIQYTFRFCRRLVTQWRRREIQSLIEAAKVSAAMILTVGFSFLIGIDKKSLSGPNIIAFVSGANPVEALQASIVRLTACILGTVMGFFAGSYSSTAVQKVASLCVLMFLGTFFRSDKDYGIMAVYAMFVLIPLDTVGHTTTEDTLARMNQITFGILIYVSISVIVLPLSPGLILRKKRINILLRVSEALTSLCDMFSEPLPIDSMHCSTLPIYRESIVLDENYEGSNLPDADFLKNASTRLMVRVDRPMLKISELLDEIEGRLEATYPFMGFARAERGIVDADYPAKSCEKTTYHLYRIVSLLRTAWCSWEVLRTQKHYAPDTRHVLHCLQPIAWDVCRSFQRFVGMLCYSLRNPHVSLEMELIQVVLELIQATEELHLRKNQMMLFIICNSVEKHASYKKEPNFFTADVKTVQSAPHKETGLMALGGLGRKRVDDGGSILPLLRKGTKANLEEDDSPEPPESVALPDNFVMPITGADAEGLHSFTLSMQMFADETKKLLMCLEEMLDHLRKKM